MLIIFTFALTEFDISCMKKICSALLVLVFSYASFSQTTNVLKDEQLLREALKKEKYEIDSSAQAVILFRKVSVKIINNRLTHRSTRESLEYTVDFIAKILSDEAAGELAKIDIARFDGTAVTNISGETYNLEGEAIKKQELKKQEIIKDEFTEGLNIFKFNLPSVKKGSVIHYTYTTTRPNFLSIPDEYLQLEYPILLESYELMAPSYYLTLKKLERVNVPIKQAKSINELNDCDACSWSEEYSGELGSYSKWVRRNVPALQNEPFMGSRNNFQERIRTQIETILFGGNNVNYLNNWDDYERSFIYSTDLSYASQVFKENSFLKDKTTQLIQGKQSEKDKAKSIYAFVRDSFVVKYLDKEVTLKSTFQDRAGTEDELNLVLVAMLKRAGLNSSPAYLSPKPNERLNPYFPDNRNLDIIAALQIGTDTVYLDASKKQLPFGVVLPENYNGYARLVDKKSKGVELDPNMLTEKSMTVASLKPGKDPGQFVLTLDHTLGVLEAYDFRKQMAGDTGAIRKAVIKSIKENSSSFALTDLKVDNLNNPDEQLKIHVDATWPIDPAAKNIYLNPFFSKLIDANPFTADQRIYPIEMEHLDNKNYIFSIQVPQGYVLDDYPKSATLKLDEQGNMLLKNLYAYDETSQTLSLKSSLKSTSCVFPAAQYEGIKTFYGKAIEIQNQKIVIKKSEQQ